MKYKDYYKVLGIERDADIVIALRTAGRLRADLELEPQALALTLISRIRALEAQLGELRAQLPRRFR